MIRIPISLLAAFCLSLWCAPSLNALSDDPLFVANGEILRGTFSQQRNLSGFATPIESRGDFTLAPTLGLIWQTRTPFPTVVVFTGQGMTQKAGDTEVVRLSASEMPYFAVLYRMLESALSGHWDALAEHYEVTQTQTDQGSQVVLTPRQGTTAPGTFLSVTIRYSRQVDRIDIRKPDGDTDVLRFSDVQRVAGAANAAEQALFDFADR